MLISNKNQKDCNNNIISGLQKIGNFLAADIYLYDNKDDIGIYVCIKKDNTFYGYLLSMYKPEYLYMIPMTPELSKQDKEDIYETLKLNWNIVINIAKNTCDECPGRKYCNYIKSHKRVYPIEAPDYRLLP